MKKGQFSYENGRSQSHASLNRYRNGNIQTSRGDSLTTDSLNNRPNVKYFAINHDQNNHKIAKKSNINKKQIDKEPEQLRKQNKLLQFQLKKKLNQNTILCKFLRTKNSSELSHIDIYLELSKLQELADNYQQQKLQSQLKLEECTKQLEQLLFEKQNQELMHTRIIEEASQKIEQLELKYKQEKNKEIAEYNTLLNKQKNKYQQTKILLSQIKKKLQETKRNQQQTKRQLEYTMASQQETKHNSQDSLAKLSKKYKQQMEELSRELQEKNDLIEKQKVREKESQLVIEQMKNYYEGIRIRNIKQLQNTKVKLHQLCSQLAQKQQQIKNLNKQCQTNKSIANQNQGKTLENQSKNKLLEQKISNYQQDMRKYHKSTEQLNSYIQKMEQQTSKTTFKNNQLEGLIKVLRFQIDDKQSQVDKNTAKMEESHRITQQLQHKLYLKERQTKISSQRNKQLQAKVTKLEEIVKKQQKSNRNQVQCYKSIGRLMQLIHSMQSLLGTTYNNISTQAQQCDENISVYITMLTTLLNLFLKNKYHPIIQTNHHYKQHIKQMQAQATMLFNAYNNFVQDQQITAYVRELLEEYTMITEDHQNVKSKNRTQYVQLILQKLISMNAIKSYASDQAQNHQYNSWNPLESSNNNHHHHHLKREGSLRKFKDSLENTLRSRKRDQDIRPQYQQEHQMDKYCKNNSNRYSRESLLKLRGAKLETEPSQIYTQYQNHAPISKYKNDKYQSRQSRQHIRRLYTQHQCQQKQNNKNRQNTIMNRINYGTNNEHNDQQTYSKLKKTQNVSFFNNAQSNNTNPVRNRGKSKDNTTSNKNNGKTNDEYEEIEKKYFR